MSRLRYTIEYYPAGGPSNPLVAGQPAIVVTLFGPNNTSSNSKGTPQISFDGGAFANFSVLAGIRFKTFNSLVVGSTHTITYKDDNGTRKLCDITIPNDPQCRYCNNNPTAFTITTSNTGFTMGYDPGIGCGTTQPDVSVDGGATWMTLPSSQLPSYAIPANHPNLAGGFLQQISTRFANGFPPGAPCTSSYVKNILMAEIADLVANISGTACTANGADDGTVQVQVTAGTGSYEVRFTAPGFMPDSVTNLSGTPSSTSRISLAPNTYNVIVTDLISGQIVNLSYIVTEPVVVPPTPSGGYLFVPMLNSLTFVKPLTDEPDDCVNFQTMDNTLFCKQKFPGFYWQDYYQKVAQCDKFPLQFLSDYTDHVVELRSYGNGDVLQPQVFDIVQKEANTNLEKLFQVFITANPEETSRSRVYFQTSDMLPIIINTGDTFNILNNADGFTGTYTVAGIGFDELMGKQYLLINKIYGLGAPSSNADAKFLVSTADFDVYEFEVDFSAVPPGKYYMKIIGASGDTPQTWVSEPIKVAGKHEGTNLIKYRNFDNAFDMTYSTGITCQRRVESRLFNRLPGADDESYRNLDQSLVKLMAKRRRGFLFETFLLTPYLHETLCVIFGHDFFSINGVRYQTDEKYEDPRYITRYPLSNSSIKIEQYGWFDKYNSDDIGPVDNIESGFIIANGGFLKR